MLQNTEGGNPVVPIVDADLPRLEYGSSAPQGLTAQEKGQRARVFQGGNYVDLHKMLGVHAGSEVQQNEMPPSQPFALVDALQVPGRPGNPEQIPVSEVSEMGQGLPGQQLCGPA